MVDVAHDRDDRRARRRGPVGVLVDGLGLDVVGGVDDLDLLVELVGEDLDRVVGQRLRERRHLAERHQLLDDLGDGDAEVLGDVLDGRARVDADGSASIAALSIGGDRVVVGAAAARDRGAGGAAAGSEGPPCRRREACESITTRRPPPGRVAGRALAGASRASGAPARRAAPPPSARRALPGAAGPARAGGRARRRRLAARAPRGRRGVGAAAAGARGAGARSAAPRRCAGARALSAARCSAVPLRVARRPPSAFSAAASSTAEAGALASIPAAFSLEHLLARRVRAPGRSRVRALAHRSPILRAWVIASADRHERRTPRCDACRQALTRALDGCGTDRRRVRGAALGSSAATHGTRSPASAMRDSSGFGASARSRRTRRACAPSAALRRPRSTVAARHAASTAASGFWRRLALDRRHRLRSRGPPSCGIRIDGLADRSRRRFCASTGASLRLGPSAAVARRLRSPTLSLSIVGQRLVGVQAAVARAGQRGVGAATAVGEDGRAAPWTSSSS